MKLNFRKIVSALASTAMVGSTVAVAAAANFPAPFVSNGVADVAIVYGNSLDLGAVTDISTALSAELASGSDGAASLSSKPYPLFTSSTPIQLNNSIASVRDSVTEGNLPILADSEFSGNVAASVSFQIIPGVNRVTFAKQPTSSDDPTLAIAMSTSITSSPWYLYNATATFNRAVNLSHADSEGQDIELFGEKFTVSSATDDDELVLFRSAETLSLSVGGSNQKPTADVVVDGKAYTIELVTASDTSATVRVTDSTGKADQKSVNEAASKKINGLEVAVNDADESTATNVVQAEIVVGANRIKLQNGNTVFQGTDDDPIEGTRVLFSNASTDVVGSLTKISVSAFAPDGSDDALKVGDAFTDPTFGSFRFVFSGVGSEESDLETIKAKAAGTDKVSFSFANWQGKELSNFEFVNNESGGLTQSFLGDSNEWVIYVQEMATINESSYAMVGNEEDGFLVKLRQLTNTTGSGSNTYSNDKIVFENVLDSTETWEATISAEGTGTITIGGKSYTVSYKDNNAGDNTQHVRLNDASSSGQNMILYPTVETSKGAKLALYEPLTINLQSWDGGSNQAAGFLLPDGDGYTTLTATAGTINNWSIGGSAYFNVTDSTKSVNATVGRLTYAFIGAGAADGSTNKTTVKLLDPLNGGQISVPSIVIFEEKDESSNYEAVIMQTSGAGTTTSGMGIGDTDFTWNSDNDFGAGTAVGAWGTSGLQRESNDKLYDQMDQWGTLVTTDQSDSDQYAVEVSYPDNQVTALIYVDSLATGSSSGALGDVKILDEQLSSSGMSGKNLIVVGGSCVNSAAKSLLGDSAECGASWDAATGAGQGEWIIQTFANPWGPNKVATLVAGWETEDTQSAATHLTTQTVDTSVGQKLPGATTSVATPTTA